MISAAYSLHHHLIDAAQKCPEYQVNVNSAWRKAHEPWNNEQKLVVIDWVDLEDDHDPRVFNGRNALEAARQWFDEVMAPVLAKPPGEGCAYMTGWSFVIIADKEVYSTSFDYVNHINRDGMMGAN